MLCFFELAYKVWHPPILSSLLQYIISFNLFSIDLLNIKELNMFFLYYKFGSRHNTLH